MLFLKEAYHFGDLNYAKPAEQTDIIIRGKRGTGHFGTGFYTVSFYDENKTPSFYWKRGHWEIDLDKYNLFKPINNGQAYDLHRAFSLLDDLDLIVLKNYDPDKLYHELDDLQYYYDNKGILKFLNKYYPDIFNDWNFKQDFKDKKWGAIEDYAKEFINHIKSLNESLDSILDKLSSIFKLDKNKVLEMIQNLLKQDSTDSYGTRFMKMLGYEGIDVSHLNKDSDGMSGLDNFSYGSVVYNLKPNTYRKIK